jgi:hypothetical protein
MSKQEKDSSRETYEARCRSLGVEPECGCLFAVRKVCGNHKGDSCDCYCHGKNLAPNYVQPFTPPVVSAEELLACLFTEFQYWQNSNTSAEIQIGATGALSNVIAFATVAGFRCDWHPHKEGNKQ